MKRIILLFLGAAMLPALADTPPTDIDVKKLPSQSKMIEQVVVPVPTEIFAVLDKLGRPRWSAVLHKEVSSMKPSGESSQVALMLGTVIAEGFIAVEAEDTEEVKKIGQAILTFSEALGVKKAVVRRANSIIEFADKKSWSRVRREIDGALSDVRGAMIELNSEPLAQLVSIGGWLRGTEALTAVVTMSYSRDGAELLYQPSLIDYFTRRISGMKARLRSPLVGQVSKGLADIRSMIIPGEGSRINARTVKDIGEITSDLIHAIQSK